jgi:Aspartyl protease
MSQDVITVRLEEKFLRRHQALYVEAALNLDVQTGSGTFVLVPFLLDTGSQFTTISSALAQQLGIPRRRWAYGDRPRLNRSRGIYPLFSLASHR